MKHVFNDGGREAAGYRGYTGDCAVRAVAIASGLSYREVYDGINALAAKERPRKRSRSNARSGVHARTLNAFLAVRGWRWVPTMQIGSGCKVHLRSDELPAGRIIVRLSRHFAAVIDGVLHDTFEDARDGSRCVYGYWTR